MSATAASQAAFVSAERERRYLRWVLSPGCKSPAYGHLLDTEKRLRSQEFAGIAHQAIWEAVEAVLATSGRVYLADVETAVTSNPRGGNRVISVLRDLTRVEIVAPSQPETPAGEQELGELAVELRSLASKRTRLKTWQYGAEAAAADNQDGADRALITLTQSAHEQQTVEHLETHEVIERAFEDYLGMRAQPERIHRTGFQLLDWAIGALKPQTMWVIGGTPNSGKSGFALSVSMRMAKAGLRVGWISFEDPVAVLGERLLAMEMNIELDVEHDVSEFEVRRIGSYIKQFSAKKLIRFAYPLNLGRRELLTAIRLLHEQGAQYIVVDYLQAVRLSGSGDRRNFIIDLVAEAKGECAARNMGLILLSQLNRPKDDPFAEPTNARLKESSDIEDKAEIISLIWKTSDDEDAKSMMKVTKVKWSGRRPRGELVRDSHGTITDWNRVDKPQPAAAPPKRVPRLPRIPGAAE